MADNNQSDITPQKLAKPKQLESLTADQTVAVILRLAMEISVLRDRITTQEKLLVQNEVFEADDVENYQADAEENTARSAARTELIEGLIRDMSQ